MTAIVKTSYAFDPAGNREPMRDDTIQEDIGDVPDGSLDEFLKMRHPKAVHIKVFSAKTNVLQ